MPVAKVYVPAATLKPDQRRDIVKGIHEVINGVEKRAIGAQTYVLISDVPTGGWGNAGAVYAPRA
jgi:phenylpyruvate tautomerase PptA (4-oxalocrotonate tautomerase family)